MVIYLVEEEVAVAGVLVFVVVVDGINAGSVEKFIKVGGRREFEMLECGGDEVTVQRTEVGVVLLNFRIFVQRRQQELTDEVVFGGAGSSRIRVINLVG